MSAQPLRWLATIVLATLLAGCDGIFTVDLGTDPPADPAIADVQANLLGVELRKADNAVTTLGFRDSEPVDLRDLATASSPLRLFTSETLPTGDYTLALTCQGDADALGVSDELVFSNAQNISLDDGETLRLDLD